MSLTSQTRTEEWFNSLSHGLTTLAAIGGMVVLIVFSANSYQPWSLLSALFYGISLVLLYAFSTVYHGLKHDRAKRIFNILDHCGIFLLIAGTYTPVLLLAIGGTTGWVLFGILWGMAVIGIVLKVFFTGKYNLLSTAIYVFMGWIIMFKLQVLIDSVSTDALWLLISGGISYTLGIIFFLLDYRMRFAHFVWHLFVIGGSLLHYLMMVLYIFR